MSSFAYADFPLMQFNLERPLIVTRIFQTTLQSNGQRPGADAANFSLVPMPVQNQGDGSNVISIDSQYYQTTFTDLPMVVRTGRIRQRGASRGQFETVHRAKTLSVQTDLQ